MRRFIAVLSLFAMALIFQMAGPASAASITATGDLAAALTADSLLLKTQGYGGGGGGGYNGEDGEDGDDDSDNYRYRRRYSDRYGYRRHSDNGYGYCRSCAYRCNDGGWCPPRCWGWWRNCRWNRRDY
jgi:hypothetical protein